MPEKKELVMLDDGTTVLRVINEYPKRIIEDVLKDIAKSAPVHFDRAFEVNGCFGGIMKFNSETFFYLKLKTVKISSYYELDETKSLVAPKFLPKTEENDKKYPTMPAVWAVPQSMSLMFAARIYPVDGIRYMTKPSESCFLIAYDSSKRAYRLPLPNLYENLSMCMGDFNGVDNSQLGSFLKAYGQFDISPWNADLLGGKEDSAKQLFLFKMTDSDVECIPYTGDWTQLCNKCATNISTSLSQAV